jgi:glutamate carboxypeptidase
MKQVLATLEELLPEGIEFLQQMVDMESPTFDKPLVDKLAGFVAGRFESIGGQVSFTPAQGFGNHLRVRFPGGGDRPILLLGHTDTVFPAGEVAKRPFNIEGDIARGPGVFDMKSGIAMMWMAIHSVVKVRGQLSNPVTVLLTSDEEVGGRTSQKLIEEEALKAQAVLVLEPSLPGGTLKTARKGVGRFTLKTIGKAAHSGINPADGINSIEEMAHQVLKLQSMSTPESGTTVTVGVIQGGTRSNVVPAESAIEIDARITSMEEAERVATAIRSLSPVLEGSALQVRGAINRPPMVRTEHTGKLFDLARQVAEKLGHDLEEGSTGGASDGNFTAALGIPTLDGLGPIGLGPHQVDEHIQVSSLVWRTALVAGLIEGIDM